MVSSYLLQIFSSLCFPRRSLCFPFLSFTTRLRIRVWGFCVWVIGRCIWLYLSKKKDVFDYEVGAGDEGRVVVVVAFERDDGEFVSVEVMRTTLVAEVCWLIKICFFLSIGWGREGSVIKQKTSVSSLVIDPCRVTQLSWTPRFVCLLLLLLKKERTLWFDCFEDLSMWCLLQGVFVQGISYRWGMWSFHQLGTINQSIIFFIMLFVCLRT